MFPGVNLLLGFKMPKFEKYDRHGDPIAYLRRYCNQLRGAGEKEELLIDYFGQSLSDNVEFIPGEKSLTNIKKKSTESFREYAIRWREQATRVKPSIKESKIVEVFIQAQDEIYYQHLLPTLGKPFIEVLKMGEMIKDGIKTDHIVSFAILKAITQAIQKGLGNVGDKKNEEDASVIVVGKRVQSRRLRRRHSQAQTQVHAQAPYNHSQNPFYSIHPPPYLVYNAQPYFQPSSFP
ncbi:hypothetical protein FXO38_06604 [Capsicum annuum]|uniref:Retrotransposon gag domain-containing protein n=1 Tax=Capsicum annuum TaxID=4072 RepID=A0A2G2ZR20_CAPAN|nr:hypothetical protein FXO37_14757 [Capsicum annuum]KAF3671373.1 hypothetical protein FXO38_06604 [Capsicum annuum]PHT84397.1 hypothetical protein T459_12840 [Capsicum annuum]